MNRFQGGPGKCGSLGRALPVDPDTYSSDQKHCHVTPIRSPYEHSWRWWELSSGLQLHMVCYISTNLSEVPATSVFILPNLFYPEDVSRRLLRNIGIYHITLVLTPEDSNPQSHRLEILRSPTQGPYCDRVNLLLMQSFFPNLGPCGLPNEHGPASFVPQPEGGFDVTGSASCPAPTNHGVEATQRKHIYLR
jgi:hypothetical protein